MLVSWSWLVSRSARRGARALHHCRLIELGLVELQRGKLTRARAARGPVERRNPTRRSLTRLGVLAEREYPRARRTNTTGCSGVSFGQSSARSSRAASFWRLALRGRFRRWAHGPAVWAEQKHLRPGARPPTRGVRVRRPGAPRQPFLEPKVAGTDGAPEPKSRRNWSRQARR